jgi:hypothetical protein
VKLRLVPLTPPGVNVLVGLPVTPELELPRMGTEGLVVRGLIAVGEVGIAAVPEPPRC